MAGSTRKISFSPQSVIHGATSGTTITRNTANDNGNWGIDAKPGTLEARLVARGYDYWALGHVHQREVVHEAPHVVFPGNLQGRHVRDKAPILTCLDHHFQFHLVSSLAAILSASSARQRVALLHEVVALPLAVYLDVPSRQVRGAAVQPQLLALVG